MLTSFVRLCRVVMLCASVLTAVPSLEGLVLCYCGGPGVEIEAGISRCSDLPNVGSSPSSATQASIAESHCGPCVDVPLGNAALGIGKAKPATPSLIECAQAYAPEYLQVDPIAAAQETPRRWLRSLAPLSSSHTTSPLRC